MSGRSALILGGGLSGAATAWSLALAGFDPVTVVERSGQFGGLAGSFERDGRFYPLGYHHILHRDHTLLFFLDRIGALPRVRWRRIRMFFRVDGRLYDLARPADFLRFPLSLLDKARFVRLMLRAFVRRDWEDWHGRTARELVDRWAGPRVREALFEPLCRLKFEVASDDVSAAWLGARLHFREGSAPLGYIPDTNWTKVLCDGVEALLRESGCRLRLEAPVKRLLGEGDRLHAAELAGGERIEADVFVSSLPPPVYLELVPRDATPVLADIRYTQLLSTICATRQTIEPDFYWLNLAPGRTACGIFLLDSLNPSIGAPGDRCVNFVTHLNGARPELFALSDEALLARYADDFREVFGADLEPCHTHVARVPLYSPVFDPGYRNPPVRSSTWRNVWFAGNYRTFPSVASTGTALRSGLEAGESVLAESGIACDLGARADAFRPPGMPRAPDA